MRRFYSHLPYYLVILFFYWPLYELFLLVVSDPLTLKGLYINPNHSYLSQLDVTYKTPDLMSHFLPPHEVSFTFCCSSIVF
ncbi:hypothetical protein, partial [Streptococcus pneumoniae]|uniref:hypothetical protein n=1 Tax=Streptococcus pneumoniae TaxID=1313 RepID=UPI000993E80E